MNRRVRIVQVLVTTLALAAVLLIGATRRTWSDENAIVGAPMDDPFGGAGPGAAVGAGLALAFTWFASGAAANAAFAKTPEPRNAGPFAPPKDETPPVGTANAWPPAPVLPRRPRISGEPVGIAGMDPIAHLTFAAEKPSPVLPDRDIDSEDPQMQVLDANDPLLKPPWLDP